MSTQCSIACNKSSGVPTHIKYLGLSLGSRGVVNSTTSLTFSFDSQTLTHHIAIPSVANCDKYSADSFLISKSVHHCTIGKSTHFTLSYFFIK